VDCGENALTSSGQLTRSDELEVLGMLSAVVRSLVDKPDDVEVVAITEPSRLTFQIRTNPAAMGKVIGRQGRVARALRVILSANAARLGYNLGLDIVPRENGSVVDPAENGSLNH
jgi:predicted RNA-binding protein YlqC (UPF0109 family)